MKSFPDFMKNPVNKVDASQQNTTDIDGYYFQGADGAQMAFWECHADKISKTHIHPFDEYMVCVCGEYTFGGAVVHVVNTLCIFEKAQHVKR